MFKSPLGSSLQGIVHPEGVRTPILNPLGAGVHRPGPDTIVQDDRRRDELAHRPLIDKGNTPTKPQLPYRQP